MLLVKNWGLQHCRETSINSSPPVREPRILLCSLSSLAVSPLLPAVPRSDSVAPGRGAAQAQPPPQLNGPSLSLAYSPPRGAVERECVLPVTVPACTPISVVYPSK